MAGAKIYAVGSRWRGAVFLHDNWAQTREIDLQAKQQKKKKPRNAKAKQKKSAAYRGQRESQQIYQRATKKKIEKIPNKSIEKKRNDRTQLKKEKCATKCFTSQGNPFP